jgi:ABC-type phosphate/phosphonate transport system substrate-binding protein
MWQKNNVSLPTLLRLNPTMNSRIHVAALPWYTFPSTRPALDAVWSETRSRLAALGIERLPAALSHTADHYELLADPQLVLSQCCGLDLFQPHSANIVPFAAPVITAIDVAPGMYFSYIVTQSSATLKSPRVVINSRFSHSGHSAMKAWLKRNGITDYTITESGSHAHSIVALREGHADLAAIDALSWQHIDTSGVEILDSSDPAPAPPFVMGRNSSIPVEALTVALNEAFKRHGQDIGISSVAPACLNDYREMLTN